MSRTRARRKRHEASCEGKQRYPSRAAAIAALRGWRRRQFVTGVQVYKCSACCTWHLGHPPRVRHQR